MDRRLRVGVVGGRRGVTLARSSEVVRMEAVAVCDLDLSWLLGLSVRG